MNYVHPTKKQLLAVVTLLATCTAWHQSQAKLTPDTIHKTEVKVITLFRSGLYEVKEKDTRSFNDIVRELLEIAEINRDAFVHKAAQLPDVSNPEAFVDLFVKSLHTFINKTEDHALWIAGALKPFFSLLPVEIQDLLVSKKFVMLKGLRTRLKRNFS